MAFCLRDPLDLDQVEAEHLPPWSADPRAPALDSNETVSEPFEVRGGVGGPVIPHLRQGRRRLARGFGPEGVQRRALECPQAAFRARVACRGASCIKED